VREFQAGQLIAGLLRVQHGRQQRYQSGRQSDRKRRADREFHAWDFITRLDGDRPIECTGQTSGATFNTLL
jgi:hypothetical protein